MNWVDIVIIIVAAIGGYIGWKHGLIRTAFSFVGLIIGVVLAGVWAPDLADKISSESQWAYIFSFAIILIIVLIIANIAGKIAKPFLKLVMMGLLDSFLGAVIGIIVGALVMAAILSATGPYIANVPGAGTGLKDAIGDSILAEVLIDNFGLLLALLPGDFDTVKDFFD